MKSPIVVLGATGNVGCGVVEAAVAAGWPLIAVARDGQALQQLRSRHPKADLTVLVADVGDDADGARLAKALRKLGRPLGGVVACLAGTLERGRVLDHPAATLRRGFEEDVLPHLAAARQLLPLLAEGGRSGGYVLVSGTGEHPWAGYGHRSITAATLQMLARVLHDEARALPVRVQLLAIDRPVCTENNRRHACAQWPSAFAVGRRALALLARHDGHAGAVVHYDDLADVDFAVADSTQTYPGDDATVTDAAAPHADASGAPLLPSRCLQDARTLLKTLISPNRNQEPSSP